jgi:hypothetical protein
MYVLCSFWVCIVLKGRVVDEECCHVQGMSLNSQLLRCLYAFPQSTLVQLACAPLVRYRSLNTCGAAALLTRV